MSADLWLLLGIAIVGIVSVHVERRRDAIERRAKQIGWRDYA